MNRKQVITELEKSGMFVATNKRDGFNGFTIRKDGTCIYRYSFFYTGGQRPEHFAEVISCANPRFNIVSCATVRKNWPADSYFEVVFTVMCDTEMADEIIQASEFGDMVEDYEYNPETGEHVYTLEDGTTVTITNDGSLFHNVDDDDDYPDYVEDMQNWSR